MAELKIGKDQWVEQYEQRRRTYSGLRGLVMRAEAEMPLWQRMGILVFIALFIPLITQDTFIIRVAGTTALMATLATGLNVVVGYTGMLDLGFVAFYGIGAYTYAYLSSDFTGIHLSALFSIPLIVLLTALAGLLLGLPSLRLVGDYLAIVTLAFGQIFVQLTLSLTRVELPGREETVDLTHGPNGITQLDPFSIFGWTADSNIEYYFIMMT